ncbi:hypothetical protein [Edaphobacter bradus]|uniref:hypothetical protein n=1 Tax=Edaphobacter bradus TaxID=2259016 RepID=UPI0021E04C3E|nr:hypothetical protein [Edaphobacter bradus]
MTDRQQDTDGVRTAGNPSLASTLPRTDYDLIRWHAHAAMVTVLIAALFGIMVATKFNFPTFWGATHGRHGADFATTTRKGSSSVGWEMHSSRSATTLYLG